MIPGFALIEICIILMILRKKHGKQVLLFQTCCCYKDFKTVQVWIQPVNLYKPCVFSISVQKITYSNHFLRSKNDIMPLDLRLSEFQDGGILCG